MTFKPRVTFEEYASLRDAWALDVAKWGAVLRAFPRLPNGLTPDAVKFSPEYRAAKHASETAFRALRQLNGLYAKRFAAETKAAIHAGRLAKLAKAEH